MFWPSSAIVIMEPMKASSGANSTQMTTNKGGSCVKPTVVSHLTKTLVFAIRSRTAPVLSDHQAGANGCGVANLDVGRLHPSMQCMCGA